MAQQECTGTAAIAFTVQAQAQVSAYTWCTREDIQTYLDEESTITIGSAGSDATFDEVTAKRLENDVVTEIVTYLSAVFNLSAASESDILVANAAKLTAAQIGMGRQASSIGVEVAHWTIRLENKTWASLQRIFISQSLSGTAITAKNVPLWQRLLMAKTRERSIVPNV